VMPARERQLMCQGLGSRPLPALGTMYPPSAAKNSEGRPIAKSSATRQPCHGAAYREGDSRPTVDSFTRSGPGSLSTLRSGFPGHRPRPDFVDTTDRAGGAIGLASRPEASGGRLAVAARAASARRAESATIDRPSPLRSWCLCRTPARVRNDLAHRLVSAALETAVFTGS